MPRQFKSSLVVPSVSPDAPNSGNIQAVWPGLQNEAANAVLQNLVENQDGGPLPGGSSLSTAARCQLQCEWPSSSRESVKWINFLELSRLQ